MLLADDPLRSEEASNETITTELPFILLQSYLAEAGVSVPKVHLYDKSLGQVWLDDLGDVTLLEKLATGQVTELYRNAIDLLIQFQQAMASPPADFIACQRRFEASLLIWELEHYVEWRVEEQLQKTPSTEDAALLPGLFEELVSSLQQQPQVVCHRDYQSTNIMHTQNGLVLIDFQDALMGPYAYDMVALLRDSYVQLESTQVDALIDYYLESRRDLNPDEFRAAFDYQTVQRKLKDAGRFVYIDRVKNDPRYLKWVNSTLDYVRLALARRPELNKLNDCLKRLDPEAFE